MTMTPVGTTAQWIAAARALETESPSPLFTDPYGRDLAGEAGFALMTSMRGAMGAPTQAGPDPYLSIRTKYLDDRLLDAVRQQQFTQLVILAAGMDTRAFRIDWPQRLSIFELDRDDVFDVKEPLLTRLGAAPTCDRHVVRVDLAREWLPALRAAGFDAARPTAFLVEGLLMYLDPFAVERVMQAIADVAADGSWIGMDLVNPEMLDSPYTAPVMRKLASFGCSWHFATPDPEAFLVRFGWQPSVVSPGDPDVSYGRWPLPPVPRAIPGLPRTFFATGIKGPRVPPTPQAVVSRDASAVAAAGDGLQSAPLLNGNQLSVREQHMTAGASQASRRYSRALQFVYVLSGRLDVEIDGTGQTVAARHGITIPPSVFYRLANTAAEDVEFLLVAQPGGRPDQVEGE